MTVVSLLEETVELNGKKISPCQIIIVCMKLPHLIYIMTNVNRFHLNIFLNSLSPFSGLSL